MLRRAGLAPGALVLLVLLLLASCGGDGDSPIRVGSGSNADASPRSAATHTPTPTANRPRASGSATPAIELLCGRRDLDTKYTPEGRLRSPAQPAPVTGVTHVATREDAGLRETIERSAGEDAEKFGVAVISLRDGRAAALNGDRSFYAASLYKLTVLYEVYRQRELNLLTFDERLLYTPYYEEYDLVGAPFAPCSEVPVGTLVRQMITISDNASAVMLQDRVGASAVNRDMEALGLTGTALASEGVRTTARDVALLLELIARGQAVSAPASAEMLGLLQAQTVRNRIPAGVPANTPVGNKTGDWNNETHDVGIVDAPFGTYVIAVLSEQRSAGPLARLSAEVYRYLATGELPPKPSPSPSPTPRR